MNIYKSWLYVFQMFNLFTINTVYIQLYNTDEALDVQYYDCIYYNQMTAATNETTPYCIRTKKIASLNWSIATHICKNFGKE
jgi:hypothetical protein